MRFADKLKFAFHNIWNAKSRNFLTIIIVFIVSLLILVIGLSCISFATNISAASKIFSEQTGGSFTLYAKMDYGSMNSGMNSISDEEYTKFIDALKDTRYCESVSSIINTSFSFRTANSSVNMYTINAHDYNYGFISNSNILVQGRVWNSGDVGTSRGYIEKGKLEEINKQSARQYGLGDTITFDYYNYSDGNNERTTFDMEIIGILDYEKAEFDGVYYYNSDAAIMDIKYINSKMKNALREINVNFSLPNTKYNYNAIMSEMTKIEKTLDKQFDHGFEQDTRVENSLVFQLKMITIMNVVIVGLGLFLGFIVLMLSIGSVANTIIISIDKNKRFTGLMMAMGMKHKNIKAIVRTESTVTIFIGILLSTILCFCLTPVFSSVLGGLFNSLTGMGEFYQFKFTIPLYFPLGVAGVFALMAIIFSRGGLRKLGKLDPITVISEVS